MTHRLSRDVTVMFNGGGKASAGYEVHAAAGTILKEVLDGTGVPHYAIPRERCQVAPSVAALFKHDGYYHYVYAPADAVEQVA